MPENFREHADLTKIIKSILDSYPSNGILRELLQNSDDAKATTQVFTLDLRTHPVESLVDPDLVDCQGPALLATNDTLFSESDWKAISTLHSSSKTHDETKTGKFGIGVRASYHITDNPHFLSGDKLAIFDPHERFTENRVGGVRIDVITEGDRYRDHLAAFGTSLPPAPNGSFPGTVVRLPLRNPKQALKSTIKPIAVSPSDILNLFDDFVRNELAVVMLFLKHIRQISLNVITPDGREHFIGSADIPESSIAELRTFSRDEGARNATFKCTINVKTSSGTDSQLWRICHSVESRDETSRIMAQQLRGTSYNVESKLTADKLFSHVALAFPVHWQHPLPFEGKLFTLLPLPIKTEFPVHLHAILALTQDRQSLRNIEELGTGPEARERLLVTWNCAIFDLFLPKAWVLLLQILIEHDEVEDIWHAWPGPALNHLSPYWEQILPNLLEEVLKRDVSVFPAFPVSNTHVALSSALIASESEDTALLTALSRVGVSIVKPPRHIVDVLRSKHVPVKYVDPQNVRKALLQCVSAITSASSDDKNVILQYLVLPPGTVDNVINLPLIPLVNGTFVPLSKPSFMSPTYAPVTQQEEEIFAQCDNDLISLSKMPPSLSAVFTSLTVAATVNVTSLDGTRVHSYLHDLFGRFNPAHDEVQGEDADVAWLSRFWKWMLGWGGAVKLLQSLGAFHLLPTTLGTLRKIQSRIVVPISTANGEPTMRAWGTLGVHFLHSATLPYSSAFKDFILDPADFVFLVESISTDRISRLNAASALMIQEHIHCVPWPPRQRLCRDRAAHVGTDGHTGLPIQWRQGLPFKYPHTVTW